MDRFYQADHGGTVHQRHALALHRRKAAASIISVQLNPNLGKAFVVQINSEADFFLLCRLLVGKLVRRQVFRRRLEIADFQFAFVPIGPNDSAAVSF